MKGATSSAVSVNVIRKNFNPRTREGCDFGCLGYGLVPLLISIHAPVKGATHVSVAYVDLFGISIHAPVKGATTLPPCIASYKASFQSTHP